MKGNWYWLAVVDVLTGYGLVATIRKKKAAVVAKSLAEVLDLMDYKLGTKVHTMSADHGREFFAEVLVMLKKRRITMKQVARGSRVEKFNQDFQRNFYRLLRMRRGDFDSLQQQALDVTNNTKNKNTKKTPEARLRSCFPYIHLEVLRGQRGGEKMRPIFLHFGAPKWVKAHAF